MERLRFFILIISFFAVAGIYRISGDIEPKEVNFVKTKDKSLSSDDQSRREKKKSIPAQSQIHFMGSPQIFHSHPFIPLVESDKENRDSTIAERKRETLTVLEFKKLSCKKCYLDQLLSLDEIDMEEKIRFLSDISVEAEWVNVKEINDSLRELISDNHNYTYDQFSKMMDLFVKTNPEIPSEELIGLAATSVANLEDVEEREKGFHHLLSLFPNNQEIIHKLSRNPATSR
ncbi:MAG: hypothetical protein KDD61_11105 [Bdellovibrionales bacterium]|nr:hypothetical protein [Bdellovibrionales bacterium]